MEIHYVNPQIQDHLNKVPTSIDLKRSTSLSISSKINTGVAFPPNISHKAGFVFVSFRKSFDGK